MDELVLYAYTFRSRAERVLWTLRELELPHRVIRLDPFKGEARTAEFLKLNPSARIPVLLHGDRVLTESLAIREYLNDLSETRHLVPRGIDANYEFRRVPHYGVTEIEPYLWVADQAGRHTARTRTAISKRFGTACRVPAGNARRLVGCLLLSFCPP